MAIAGLENFGLDRASFNRLRSSDITARVNLRSYELTPAIKRLPPTQRFPYLAARAIKWVRALQKAHTWSACSVQGGTLEKSTKKKPQVPYAIEVTGSARKILKIASHPGVSSVYLLKVPGIRRRKPRIPRFNWYCVRADVAIRIEGFTSGMQTVEDRFVIVRASSREDAKKRLRKSWLEYATPYLNSDGRLVSWTFQKVIDVYDICETDIDPDGTEVYSKLARRKIRPETAWKKREK
jgi:hypothetical protein